MGKLSKTTERRDNKKKAEFWACVGCVVVFVLVVAGIGLLNKWLAMPYWAY